jgi:hypothetical protein
VELVIGGIVGAIVFWLGFMAGRRKWRRKADGWFKAWLAERGKRLRSPGFGLGVEDSGSYEPLRWPGHCSHGDTFDHGDSGQVKP